MSAPFTPGPWLVHSTNRLICQADGAFKAVKVKNGKATGDDIPNNICLLRDPGEGFSEDETLANGFLIAAAPELYERVEQSNIALEEAAKLLEGTGYSGCADIMRGYVVKNDAALAKARGDQ